MKLGDAEYDALVRKLGEKPMHKVTQLTPEQTEAEIQEISGGAKSSFETKAGEVFDYSISPDGKSVTIQGTDRGNIKSYRDGDTIDNIPQVIQPKRKRGRPKGSRNKPKNV